MSSARSPDRLLAGAETSPPRGSEPRSSEKRKRSPPSRPTVKEPFFAVKVGPFSWFCLWGDSDDGPTGDGRGWYANAPQETDSELAGLVDDTPPSSDLGGSPSSLRPRTRPVNAAAAAAARSGGLLGKIKWHLQKVLAQIGHFHFHPLEEHRKMVLTAVEVMSFVACAFAFFAFLGGLMGGEVVRLLNWMSIPGKGPDVYLGLRHVCSQQKVEHSVHGAFSCIRFTDLNCTSMVPSHHVRCERCMHESVSMTLPMLIAVLTTAKLAWSSRARRNDTHRDGADTAKNKAMTVASCILGGGSTFFNLMFYRFSCGRLSADLRPESHGLRTWGPGYLLMSIGTVMKIACGVLHAGIVARDDLEEPVKQ